jgi:hypothetical protein
MMMRVKMLLNLYLMEVLKRYEPEEAVLYVIADPIYFSSLSLLLHMILSGDPRVYVGVTTLKPSKRFTDHKATRNGKWRQDTGPFIRGNGYTFEDCFRVLAHGSEELMYQLEFHLRQQPNMGLNKKVGGQPEGRNKPKYNWVFDREFMRQIESHM